MPCPKLAPFLFGRPSVLNCPDVTLATRKWWLQATCQKMPDGGNHSREKDSGGELSGFKEINFFVQLQVIVPDGTDLPKVSSLET